MLSAAVRDGTITRVRNGVFATPSAPIDVLTAAAHGGALTCSRALRLHGIWTLDDDTDPHVWLGTHGRNHHVECACTGHYFDGPTALGLAPLEDALVHVYRCRGDESFFVAIESTLQLRKIGAAGRARIRSRLPANARWLVDLARTDADSGLESLLRLRLHVLGIRLECQVEIPLVGRVDFVIDRLLILEADGVENHDSPSHRHRDLLRDAEASRQGYETLRFDYAMIVHDWPVVMAAVLAAIGRLRARV
jgi:very-short-patch-repair endonuclease